MAVMNLLPKGVTYYKANLHCHTVHSDGKLTPQEVKKLYQERGYSIIAFTDHRHYANHSELNDEGFLAAIREALTGSKPTILTGLTGIRNHIRKKRRIWPSPGDAIMMWRG